MNRKHQKPVEEWFGLYMLAVEGRRDGNTGPYFNHESSELDDLLGRIWEDLSDEEPLQDCFTFRTQLRSPRVRLWLELWGGGTVSDDEKFYLKSYDGMGDSAGNL